MGAIVETQNSLDLVNIRNNFYFHSYRNIIAANFLVMLLLVLIIGFYQYQKKLSSGSRYFPTTADGIIIDMQPLNINHLKLNKLLVNNKGFLIEQPKININTLGTDQDNGLVLYWAKKVALKMFDYDYINYRSALEELRNYFAPGGHDLFMKALVESKNMESIKASQRVLKASLVGDAIVKRVGILNERYAWQIFVPMDIVYENITDEPLIQKITAKMWIVRTSTLKCPFFALSVVVVNLEPRN